MSRNPNKLTRAEASRLIAEKVMGWGNIPLAITHTVQCQHCREYTLSLVRDWDAFSPEGALAVREKLARDGWSTRLWTTTLRGELDSLFEIQRSSNTYRAAAATEGEATVLCALATIGIDAELEED